jgi:hypothetical protein
MNRFLLGVIALLVLAAFIGSATSVSALLAVYAEKLLIVAEDIALIVMLVNGRFVTTRYFKVALALITMVALGVVMKIMHLPGADEMFLIPFPLLFVLYLVYVLNKPHKMYLDGLKLLTLAFFLLPGPLAWLDAVPDHVIGIVMTVGHFIFWSTFIVFVMKNRERIFPRTESGNK